jgi:hypothetical protein
VRNASVKHFLKEHCQMRTQNGNKQRRKQLRRGTEKIYQDDGPRQRRSHPRGQDRRLVKTALHRLAD